MTAIATKTFPFKAVYLAAFILYTLLVLYGISNHEPWRDEAQSWLLVRDLSFSGLFKILPDEAHPPIWYLILMPFVKLGAPYKTEGWITGLVMIGSAWVLLFRTQLPWYLKLSVIFSYFFFYEYALISRNYCLVVLFISFIIALYPQRFARPWVFALAVIGLFNSHTIAFTLAGAIAGVYLLDLITEKKLTAQYLLPFGAMLIGGLYLIPYFLFHSAASSYANNIKDHSLEIQRAINGAFFVFEDGKGVSVLLLIVFALLLFARPKAGIVLIGGLVSVFYILGYKYLGTLRHQGILFFVVFAACSIATFYKDDRLNLGFLKTDLSKYAGILLALLSLYQARSAYGMWQLDVDTEFSNAQAAADFLKEKDLTGKIIIGHPTYSSSSVDAFLPAGKLLYHPDCNRYGSYVVYDSCYFKTPYNFSGDYAAFTALTNFKDKLNDVVLLLNTPLQDPQFTSRFDLVYAAEETPQKKDEAFYIYRMKGAK